MAILEFRLSHHMSGLAHQLFFHIFLDVRKAYGLLDRGRCLEILRGYGLGPNLARLLKNYQKRQRIVPKAVNCLGA